MQGEIVLLTIRKRHDLEERLVALFGRINYGQDMQKTLLPHFLEMAEAKIPREKFNEGLIGILERYAQEAELTREEMRYLLIQVEDFFDALVDLPERSTDWSQTRSRL